MKPTLVPYAVAALTVAVAGAACSQKSTKKETQETTSQSSTAAGPGETASRPLGSTEKEPSKTKVESDIPSVTLKSTRADINRMNVQDFVKLGLPVESAESVLTYRKEHGQFASVKELKEVPDMDSAWLERMQDKLAVG